MCTDCAVMTIMIGWDDFKNKVGYWVICAVITIMIGRDDFKNKVG